MQSKNPRDGTLLVEIEKTQPEQLDQIFKNAAQAQSQWAQVSVSQRAKKLKQLREVLLHKADDIARVIHLENGKPEIEAMTSELVPTLELLTYYSSIAPSLLKDKKIPMRNVFLKYKKSYLNYWPLGTVAVISPWNYPFFLALGDIAVGVLTGNAVIFKPSEYTSWVGQKIQEVFDEAGFPPYLVQTVFGEGDLGAAIIDHRPAKIFFTGSVRTGKTIMKQASQYLIPVSLELGGKDAMLVLPDADLDFATSAALWGGFSNSGQACASTERLIVHESIAQEFTNRLKEKIEKLSTETDLGVCTMDTQKKVYEDHLSDAKSKNLEFYIGGEMSADRTRMLPSLVGGVNIESAKIFKEETFGPVIAITTYKSLQEGIQKVNDSPYGLLSSVISKNLSLAEDVAKQIHTGTVVINDVLYTAGLPETPWGGLKDSGFGRKHSELGLYEFVNVRHIHRPRFGFLNPKSFWWFPYTSYQKAFFKSWMQLYRSSLLQKLGAVPEFLWNLIQFLKNEPRL